MSFLTGLVLNTVHRTWTNVQPEHGVELNIRSAEQVPNTNIRSARTRTRTKHEQPFSRTSFFSNSPQDYAQWNRAAILCRGMWSVWKVTLWLSRSIILTRRADHGWSWIQGLTSGSKHLRKSGQNWHPRNLTCWFCQILINFYEFWQIWS